MEEKKRKRHMNLNPPNPEPVRNKGKIITMDRTICLSKNTPPPSYKTQI